MKKILFRVVCLGLLLAPALSSCVKEEMVKERNDADYEAEYLAELEKIGDVAWVDMNFGVNNELEPGEERDADTKSMRAPVINEGDDSYYSCHVFQFDGEGLDAYMTQPPYYISPERIAEYKTNGTPIRIPMLDSKGNQHRVVIVANLTDPNYFTAGTGLMTRNKSQYGTGTSQLLSKTMTIAAEGITYGDAKNMIIMTWSEMREIKHTQKDNPGQNLDDPNVLDVQFDRSLAKIQLDLKAMPGYSVTKILLKKASNVYNIFAPLMEQSPDPAMATLYNPLDPAFDHTRAANFPIMPTWIDYPAITGAKLVEDDGSTVESFVWYVARNKQGERAEATPETRVIYAPSGATFFEIYATGPDGRGIVYTIYPGENATRYNLYPNRVYRTELTIAGDGTADPSDSRIQRFDDVYLDGHSNSYIINPPTVGTRRYYIPVTRVNEFWGRPENGNAAKIFSTTRWKVDILWQDLTGLARLGTDLTYVPATHVGLMHDVGQGVMTGDIDPNYGNTAPDEENPGSTQHAEGYFYIDVPAAAGKGNFVVCLRLWGDGVWSPDIMWSWHFWVTDYDPDYANRKNMASAIDEKQFTYDVPNGQVERYGGTIWGYGGTAGTSTAVSSVHWNNYTFAADVDDPAQADKYLYRKSFIMDRPFGMSITNPPTNTLANSVHYQYGRKDPIPTVRPFNGSGVALTAVPNDAIPAQVWGGTTTTPRVMEPSSTSTLDWMLNVRLANANPLSIIRSSGDWSSRNETAHRYFDDLVQVSERYKKSIFDPCPPGWALPATTDVWLDFRTSYTQSVSNRPGGSLSGSSGSGYKSGPLYWPYVLYGEIRPVQGTIRYQIIGLRTSSTWSLSGNYAYYATSEQSSTSNARIGYINYTSYLSITTTAMSAAFAARCISLPDAP